MRWRGRLARLERALGGQVCRDCGQALGGERVFTFAEDPPAPADFEPCRGCGRTRAFTLKIRDADDGSDSAQHRHREGELIA